MRKRRVLGAGGLHSAKIRRGLEEEQEAGVRGTPTFFLGLTDSNSPKVKAVRKIVGAQPYNVFKAAVGGVAVLTTSA